MLGTCEIAHCATLRPRRHARHHKFASVNQEEQQRLAVEPGNAHCMSIRQVSLRAALVGSVLWPAAAAAIRELTD